MVSRFLSRGLQRISHVLQDASNPMERGLDLLGTTRALASRKKCVDFTEIPGRLQTRVMGAVNDGLKPWGGFRL
jgi:hypothetical protein